MPEGVGTVSVAEAQSSQINAVVPYEIARASTAVVRVQYNGQTSQDLNFLVDESSPGVFSLDSSGVGQAAVLNQDGSVNGRDNPAAKNSIVSIFETGGGLTNPPSPTGSINTGISTTLQLPVKVRLSQPIDAEILYYAGPAPSLVSGVIQIDARIPPQTVSGDQVPISLTIGQPFSSGRAAIAVR